MTHKVFRLVQRKNKVFGKYKDTNHPAVKSARKAAKVEVNKACRNFEKKLAENIKSDKKSFFAYARSKNKCKVQVGAVHKCRVLSSERDMVTARVYFSTRSMREK